jgi:hypothetical protein
VEPARKIKGILLSFEADCLLELTASTIMAIHPDDEAVNSSGTRVSIYHITRRESQKTAIFIPVALRP